MEYYYGICMENYCIRDQYIIIFPNFLGVEISMPKKFADLLQNKLWKFKRNLFQFTYAREGKYHAIAICHPEHDKFNPERGREIAEGRVARLKDRGYHTLGVELLYSEKPDGSKHFISADPYYIKMPEWVCIE